MNYIEIYPNSKTSVRQILASFCFFTLLFAILAIGGLMNIDSSKYVEDSKFETSISDSDPVFSVVRNTPNYGFEPN